ncbi:MAG TPA: DUF3592 domain-containing protein [Solirubrobacteraceae bacterium]|nr:DUF3592 domain-containing protein [Solirubrobacteraceae bacterium]
MRPWPSSIRASLFFPTWILCSAILALILSVAEQPNRGFYSRLQEHGVVVKGTVTRTEPSNHDMVFYSYTADGKRFESSSAAGPPNPSTLRPDERIHVVYDARDPSVSCACSPVAEGASYAWWRLGLIGLFLGLIVSVVLTVNIQRRLDMRADRGNGQVGLS